MIVVGIGDQDVLASVVVEIGDDGLPRLPGEPVGPTEAYSRGIGHVMETSLAIVHKQRVADAADQ